MCGRVVKAPALKAGDESLTGSNPVASDFAELNVLNTVCARFFELLTPLVGSRAQTIY